MVPLLGLVALPFANKIGGMRRGIQVGVELDVNWGKIGCAFGTYVANIKLLHEHWKRRCW